MRIDVLTKRVNPSWKIQFAGILFGTILFLLFGRLIIQSIFKEDFSGIIEDPPYSIKNIIFGTNTEEGLEYLFFGKNEAAFLVFTGNVQEKIDLGVLYGPDNKKALSFTFDNSGRRLSSFYIFNSIGEIAGGATCYHSENWQDYSFYCKNSAKDDQSRGTTFVDINCDHKADVKRIHGIDDKYDMDAILFNGSWVDVEHLNLMESTAKSRNSDGIYEYTDGTWRISDNY